MNYPFLQLFGNYFAFKLIDYNRQADAFWFGNNTCKTKNLSCSIKQFLFVIAVKNL